MRSVVGATEIARRLGVRRWYTIGEGDLFRLLNSVVPGAVLAGTRLVGTADGANREQP